jgi:hypothetical protein
MNRPARIVAVTLGLVVIGAVLGAIAGSVALGIGLSITGAAAPDSFALWFAAVMGAVLGAVTAPGLAWLLLRHVPLGRMFVGATGGTVFGGVIGWLVGSGSHPIPMDSGLLGALVGVSIAAVVMRRR